MAASTSAPLTCARMWTTRPGKQLDGGWTSEHRVARSIHDSHAAFADLFFQRVLTRRLTLSASTRSPKMTLEPTVLIASATPLQATLFMGLPAARCQRFPPPARTRIRSRSRARRSSGGSEREDKTESEDLKDPVRGLARRGLANAHGDDPIEPAVLFRRGFEDRGRAPIGLAALRREDDATVPKIDQLVIVCLERDANVQLVCSVGSSDNPVAPAVRARRPVVVGLRRSRRSPDRSAVDRATGPPQRQARCPSGIQTEVRRGPIVRRRSPESEGARDSMGRASRTPDATRREVWTDFAAALIRDSPIAQTC